MAEKSSRKPFFHETVGNTEAVLWPNVSKKGVPYKSMSVVMKIKRKEEETGREYLEEKLKVSLMPSQLKELAECLNRALERAREEHPEEFR